MITLKLLLMLAVAGFVTACLLRFLGRALSIVLTVAVWAGVIYFVNSLFGFGWF